MHDHSHLFAFFFFFLTTRLCFRGGFAGGEHQDKDRERKNNKLNGRERRQTVLSVKLGCSVAIIKGTKKRSSGVDAGGKEK